jgi:5-methylcytosine-specific restriction enzyme subunit McrC
VSYQSASPEFPESTQYTEYGIPIRNLWHMLLYAWNEAPMKDHPSMQGVESAPTLDALLASVLARLIQQRMRIGLGRSFIDQGQSIRGIRGRIDFTESLKQDTFERAQAYCEFQQYSANVPRNQIIRSTLARLVQAGNFGPDRAFADELRHRLRLLTRALDGIDLIELNLDSIHRQQLGRDDGDYRLMLAICAFTLARQMPSEGVDILGLPAIDREVLTLHHIYERFVANFYRLRLKDWTVKAQSRLSWHAKQDNPYLPSMQPDLMLEEHASGTILVLDTKFTAKNLIENQWGKQVFDSSHLYQMYAYLKSQEHVSAHHGKATGILLYPAVESNLSETIELEEHRIRIECVDLAAPWQEIERQLIYLVIG